MQYPSCTGWGLLSLPKDPLRSNPSRRSSQDLRIKVEVSSVDESGLSNRQALPETRTRAEFLKLLLSCTK